MPAGAYFSSKAQLLGVIPLSSDTKQVLLETWTPNCEIIPEKRLFFKSPKVTATGYYSIENPLPDIISKIHRFIWAA